MKQMPREIETNPARANSTGPGEPRGAGAQAHFKPLTVEQIRAYTDAGSFSKGQQYFQNGYILDAAVRGPILRGKCRGHSGGPYNIEVELSAIEGVREAGASEPVEPVVAYSCSCPRGGFCKHVVALLLLWVNEPESVEVREDLAALLKDRSREELLALVAGMLRRAPDLEQWFETMLATTPSSTGTASSVALNPAKLKKQVAAIFAERSYEWGEVEDVAASLGGLIEIADRYASAGQWANAQVVYTAVADKALEEYDSLDDQEGEVSGVIIDCGEGLVRCLIAQESLPASQRLSPDARQATFDTLYSTWEHDTHYGVWAEEESIPQLVAHLTTAEELARMEARIRQELADRTNEAAHDRFTRYLLVDFLLDLKQDASLSDEDVLAEYLSAELYEEVPDVLLGMGRVDEAIQMAAKHISSSYGIESFADKLLALGGEWQARALRFVEERQWEEQSPRRSDIYMRWLEERYISLGMQDKALKAALDRFNSTPGHDSYELIKQAAEMPGQPSNLWVATRPRLLEVLRGKGEWRALLEVHLDEGEIGEALKALTEMERPARMPVIASGWTGYHTSWPSDDYRLRLARAAEQGYPGEAIRIYTRIAEQLIEGRNRTSYAQAAELLARVKELYANQQRSADWQEYIIGLRALNKTLRALKEELDLRGLG